ncbi:MAG TPA: glycosyltransferase family 25 protein [Candidatus Dojkabacteria bacterium]|nr:glycosyltransferase family 25 protein [Candidatus Dojkabacteria bacterium]
MGNFTVRLSAVRQGCVRYVQVGYGIEIYIGEVVKLDCLFELSYVLNLDKRKDRLERLENEEWKKIAFWPTRFPAIERKNGAQGCYESHLAMLKEAEKKNKNLLVFEDDVTFFENKRTTMEKSLDELLEQEDWWIWYGTANILRPFYQVSSCLARLNHAQSTVFYGINKKHLSEIIKIVEQNPTYIDVVYSEGIVKNFPCFICVPLIALQYPDYSDIEHQNVNYNYMIDRYNQNFVSMYK